MNQTEDGTWTSFDRLVWLNSTVNLLQKYNNNFDAVAISWNENSNFTLTDRDGNVQQLVLSTWGPMNESVLNQTADSLRLLIPFLTSAQVNQSYQQVNKLNMSANGTWTSSDRLKWLNKQVKLMVKYNNNYDAVVLSRNPNWNFTITLSDGKSQIIDLNTWGPMNASILNQTADALRKLVPYMN